LLALATATLQSVAFGQAQIRFPTLDTTAPAAPSPTVTTPPGYPSYGGGMADGSAVASPSNAPASPPGTVTPFGQAPAAGPAPTLPPGGYSTAPGGAIYSPGPSATLNGTVQPPPSTFDPYSPPGAAPVVVVPQDPYYANPQQGPPPALFTLPPVLEQGYRFIQDVSLDYHWFAGHGSSPGELGINDIDGFATFALPVPFFQQPPQTPQQQPQPSMLLITPGFAWHYWDGPQSTPADGFADMPARTYDAYLDVAWNPVFVPGQFSAELEASYGIYSDFSTLTNQSYRFKGKGMAVIGIPDTHLAMKLGVWYINRGNIKLLPAGGFVWTPSPFTRFDILFPNPKFTQMFYTTPGGVEWWWYLTGEYGGGVWTIKRREGPDDGNIDLVTYDDIRFALGIDFKGLRGRTGFFEAGYAFDRQLIYASLEPSTFNATGTFYLHSGVSF
jgi:hypothetical protein